MSARLAEEGVAALKRGDGRTAFDLLSRAAADPSANPRVPWMALAQAARMVGDEVAEDDALVKQLGEDPRNLGALLAKGELAARRGDDRSASSFYSAALNQAAASGAALPPAARQVLAEAQAFVIKAQERFTTYLRDRLSDAGLDPERSDGRVGAALDLLFGRRELFLQQPSVFYFPGLPQRQFFERDEFDWLPALEAEWPAMRAELDAVLESETAFDPYVSSRADEPPPNNHLLDKKEWGAFYLWQQGEPQTPAVEMCRRTMAALENAPLPRITGRSPFALYSRLCPRTHIHPHNGLLNTRLVVHVPLIVPQDCAIRVGNETREWKEGQALIFDDSFEHEAWNRSDKDRIVLIFEIWRPELGTEERAQLTQLFEAVDLYGGQAA